MADENEVEEEKKSSIVPMILVGIVCIALGAGGTFFAVGGSSESPASSETSDVEGSADGSSAGASGGGAAVPFICTPPIGSYTINLRDPTGAHKLQMEIAVQVPCAQKKGLEDKQAEISHMINMLASDYTVTNLNGLNGRSQLKDEIHVRINKIMQPIKIDNVFFTKFIIN
jgi:flagellar basal body-associated protein FliL